MVASTNPTAPVISSLERCSVKLHKYAILPLLGASGPWERPGPRSLLPMILSSHLLDISRAHAVHHFILEEEETGNARLVLWLFTPRITLSLYSQDSSPPSSTSSAHDIQRSEGGLVPASKVLYQLVESSSSHGSEQQERGDSATARRKPLGNIHMEPISYPSFQCDLIQALLDASNLAYPASRRKFMDWNLGWLERVAR
ncbi:hypothetical protein IE53DRAFT_258590 [Violaceomyces palustris]|uniref:Uncharacterized protein n=1 Tax=Violaceomyces palustris TaxID=1673888 RepID=A0ACD0P858_9BASI|nr:hypothetical protein IE53DRAFT_258590 [Violaceomyces palustris]